MVDKSIELSQEFVKVLSVVAGVRAWWGELVALELYPMDNSLALILILILIINGSMVREGIYRVTY